MRKVFLYFIIINIFFLLMSPLAFSQSSIQDKIEEFNGFSGILVQDLLTQEVLLSHNENKLFTPASLGKLFTLLAGIEILGQEYCYPTVIYFSSDAPGEITGNLIVRGGGDPTQSPEVIKQIAHNLVKKYNIRRIYGDIILDNTLFKREEFLGRGWMWDDQNPLVGAIAIKGYSTKEKQLSYYNTMPLVWGELFCQELRRLGVQVDGDVEIGEVEEGLTIKAIHYSETLDSILSYMMKMSDNQSAEIIFRTLPLVENPDEGSTISLSITSLSEIIHESLGIQWGEDYILVDGCGLSEYNLLSPKQIVLAIFTLYRQYGTDLLKYFAHVNEKGTIRERFSFPIWGKTGSLPSASGLAGILETKKNREIVFCLMENNFFGEQNNPKVFEDSLIEYIHEKY